MSESRNTKIVKAEEGLAEMQRMLDQASRGVDAAERADLAAREAARKTMSIAKIAAVALVGIVTVLVLVGVIRRRG